MGEVYKPDDIFKRNKRKSHDLGPGDMPPTFVMNKIDQLDQEIKEIRADIERIKLSLKSKNIPLN